MEQIVWFGWFRADIIAEYSTLFWRGLLTTIGLTVICIVQGALLGLLLGHGQQVPRVLLGLDVELGDGRAGSSRLDESDDRGGDHRHHDYTDRDQQK